MTTVHLLQAFPDVREHYRRRFRHVLVDEYQDTNHAQYVLVRAAARAGGRRPAAELVVVGDADQSIYAFRGADIRNILEFERDFPDAAHDPARAELPLDADDPVAPPTPSSPATPTARPRTCGPTPATASRSPATSPTTSTTRPQFVADEIDRLTDAGRR